MASNATQLGLGALAAAVVGVVVILLVPSPERDAVGEMDTAVSEETAAVTADATVDADPDGGTDETSTADVAVETGTDPADADAADDQTNETAEADSTEVPAETDGDTSAAEPEIAADVTPEPDIAPSFDTFRIEPDGNAILAGRTASGQTVDIVVAGETITQVQADASGSFVAFFSMDPSADARTLRLIGDPEGAQVASAETIMVAPFGIAQDTRDTDEIVVAGAVTSDAVDDIEEPQADTVAETETAEAVTEEPTDPVVANVDETVEVAAADTAEANTADNGTIIIDTSADPTPIETAETASSSEGEVAEETDQNVGADELSANEGTVIASDGTDETTDQTTTAPTTLVADADGVRVLAAPEVMAAVALDTITYDPEGDVVLAGRATADGFVRVYIDNQPVTTSRIAEGGDWRTDLPEVDTGVYTLRIDEVDDAGTVVSRIETPFKREEPEAVAAVMAEETADEGFEVAVRTVQPGSTLWAIAKEEMGEGIMYVAVFEANRDLIQDPDLIYPGQVFRIPQASE